MSKLSSGFPGTIAGPESPPSFQPSAESKTKPPLDFCVDSEWQISQWSTKIGRMRASKKSLCVSCPFAIGLSPPTTRGTTQQEARKNRQNRSHME